MGVHEDSSSRALNRPVVVAILVVGYGALATCFHVVLHTDVVYNHFAYLPIVLAGVWWGRRGALVVVPLTVILLSMRALDLAVGPLWSDLARAAFFVSVALFVGALSERVSAGRQALLQSEEKYRRLIEESLAGVFVYRDDRVLFVNGRLGRMLGYEPEAMVGMSIWDLILKEHWAEVRRLLQKRASGEQPGLQYECRLGRKDASALWVDLASCPTVYEGRPAVLVNVYDATERYEAERRRRELSELARRQEEQLVHSSRLAELGEMAATIAHELNQPLTGIKNYAKNAAYMIEQAAGGPQDVAENLRLISGQVDRAARIIGQMRELTRRSERIMAPLDVNASIRETVEFLMPQLRLSNVDVSLDLAEGLPPVLGDKVRLEQVFLNLLANARQALEESAERRLNVRTYVDGNRACPVTVEVEDSGVGFAPEDRDKLFRPFYSTKKAGRGTGLGLSISLSIVREHRGEIEAAGAPGKGARFTMRLPAAVQDEHTEASHAGIT
jgi:PAS domain S-box-containing protein